MKNRDIVVIGSGPAAYGALIGLMEKNIRPTVVDSGFDLDTNVSETISSIADKPFDNWTKENVEFIKRNVNPSPGGLQTKTLFGSDFSTRSCNNYKIFSEDSKVLVSHAIGGFSNIWGTAFNPIYKGDVRGWNIPFDALSEGMNKITGHIPVTGQVDDLTECLPVIAEHMQKMQRNVQASYILNKLKTNSKELKRQGICAGASRLAADFSGVKYGRKCQYCSLCMYGCPYGILYSTKRDVKLLEEKNKIEYLPGLTADSIEILEGGKVCLSLKKEEDQKAEKIICRKLILSAGPVSNMHILMKSFKIFNEPIKLLTSSRYMTPAFTLKRFPGLDKEQKATISQVFFHITDPKISRNSVQLQVYPYNPMYYQALKNLLGRAFPIFRPMVKEILNRMVVIFQYIHSDHSPSVDLILKEDGTLQFRGHKNEYEKTIHQKIILKLLKNAFRTGIFPVPFYPGFSKPGASTHYGGGVPVNGTGKLSSKVNGEVNGLPNVYIADASQFNSIPGTSLTLGIMGNAYRVAVNL